MKFTLSYRKKILIYFSIIIAVFTVGIIAVSYTHLGLLLFLITAVINLIAKFIMKKLSVR